MSRLTAFALCLSLAAVPGLLGPQGASAAEDPPDFTGVWVFNPARSDDVRARVEESVGPETTSGDIKKDIVRIWIREWLLSVVEDPESAYLTIEQSEKDFKTGLGDDLSIFYFGREASSRGPMGGTLKVSATWQGEQLLLIKRSEDGGQIAALYTLLPGGQNLIVAYRLEHKSLKKPLEVRMIFDRAEESPE